MARPQSIDVIALYSRLAGGSNEQLQINRVINNRAHLADRTTTFVCRTHLQDCGLSLFLEFRGIMAHIRFYYTLVAPVHKLPAEILTCIFYLVSVNRCHLTSAKNNPSENSIRSPDCLAHVCSRWREIALSSPLLWTHIDLTPDTSIGRDAMGRAHAYANRAGKMPLFVHLEDKGSMGNNYYDLGNLVQSLASRMKELDIMITAPKLSRFHSSLLNSLLPELSPKALKKLSMSSEVSLPFPFLIGCDGWNNQDGRGWSPNILKCKNDVIDTGLSGLTHLHLQGIFFIWSHKLYHGLVDLRLTCSSTGRVPFIGALVLTTILMESPGLRIFHFSLELDVPDDTDSWLPVPLPDLEVVNVSTLRAGSYAAPIFRLLKPGSKPLRVTLHTGRYEHLLDHGGIDEFFARSKVERLCIKDGNLSLYQLWQCHLPDLKFLVFDSCHRLTIEAIPILPTRWNSCLVRATRLDLCQLRSIFKLCPTGLVVSGCEIRRKLRLHREELVVSEEELRAAFPTAQFVMDQDLALDPIADWDTID